MNRENALVMFAKWPELGKNKVRIGEETTHEFALEFTRACLEDIVSNLNRNNNYNMLVAVDVNEDLEKFKQYYGLKGILTQWMSKTQRQSQSEKMNSIFKQLLQSYKQVLLIPMDVPFLRQEDVISAFAMFNEKKYVLGKEFNGGMYIIGMRTPPC